MVKSVVKAFKFSQTVAFPHDTFSSKLIPVDNEAVYSKACSGGTPRQPEECTSYSCFWATSPLPSRLLKEYAESVA